MNRDEIIRLNGEYGGVWALKHSERILKWVDFLSDGQPYDENIVFVAAHLHDWGAYQHWALDGVDHEVRSVEVVKALLSEWRFGAQEALPILECIRYHHGGPEERSWESVLFTDADALDLLGVVGLLRVFSMCPRNLEAAVQAAERWRDTSFAAISTDKAHAIARARIQEMNTLLDKFREETFGLF